MEVSHGLLELIFFGFVHFFTASNLIAVFAGICVGIMIGSLPGLTATMGVALMVPLTFSLDPVTSICLLLGVYKGGTLGGRFPQSSSNEGRSCISA